MINHGLCSFHKQPLSFGVWKFKRKMPTGMVSPDISFLLDGQFCFALETGYHSGWSRTRDYLLVFASCTWVALGSLLYTSWPCKLMKSLAVLPTSRQSCGTGIFKMPHTLAVFHFSKPHPYETGHVVCIWALRCVLACVGGAWQWLGNRTW